MVRSIARNMCIRINAIVSELTPFWAMQVEEKQCAYGAKRRDGHDGLPAQHDPMRHVQEYKGHKSSEPKPFVVV